MIGAKYIHLSLTHSSIDPSITYIPNGPTKRYYFPKKTSKIRNL